MGYEIGRPHFIGATVPRAAGLGMAADLASKPISEMRLGFICVASRGSSLVPIRGGIV